MIKTFHPRTLKVVKSFTSKLKDKSFGEDDVEQLLIATRSFFKEHAFLRELGDFIAHPEGKEKGFCHQSIDVNYVKFKYVHANDGTNKINAKSIEKKLFETLVINGIEYFSEKVLIQKAGIKKKELLRLVSKNYTLKSGYYLLTGSEKLVEMEKGLNTIVSTAEMKGAFTQEQIIKQLVHALVEINQKIEPTLNIKKLVRENEDDIIVCILFLLQHAKFVLYDKSEGRSFLTTNVDYTEMQKLQQTKDISKCKIKVSLSYEVKINTSNFQSELIATKNDCKSHLIDVLASGKGQLLKELPYMNLVRNGSGKLIAQLS